MRVPRLANIDCSSRSSCRTTSRPRLITVFIVSRSAQCNATCAHRRKSVARKGRPRRADSANASFRAAASVVEDAWIANLPSRSMWSSCWDAGPGGSVTVRATRRENAWLSRCSSSLVHCSLISLRTRALDAASLASTSSCGAQGRAAAGVTLVVTLAVTLAVMPTVASAPTSQQRALLDDAVIELSRFVAKSCHDFRSYARAAAIRTPWAGSSAVPLIVAIVWFR